MSAPYISDAVLAELDDDDGMPPLVDAPAPSMTFTFATDMTPISFSADPTGYEYPLAENAGLGSSIYSPPASPVLGATRVSHAKKRDASYIPRPPNAFILFRSSFIRGEHIPGKIEGNHSALSKIIGKVWRALPREKREEWEAKAIVAQAEHRKKYPDWRFRPGANALAKVKDGPKRRIRKKGRGQAEKEVRSNEQRCAKIADLVVAGKIGLDLAAAIQEYDSAAGLAGIEESVKQEAPAQATAGKVQEPAIESDPILAAVPAMRTDQAIVDPVDNTVTDTPETRSKTPDGAFDARFKVPLTAMFKRSSSVPAARSRINNGQFPANGGMREPLVTYPSYFGYPITHVYAHEEATRVDVATLSMENGLHADSMHAMQQRSPSFNTAQCLAFGDTSQQWHDSLVGSPTSSGCFSPALPASEPDTEDTTSPLQSPGPMFFNFSDNEPCKDPCNLSNEYTNASAKIACDTPSFPTLNGWAGAVDTFGDFHLPQKPPLGQPVVVQSVSDVIVMKDAFHATATTSFGNWTPSSGTDASLDFTHARWNEPINIEGLRYYAQDWQDIIGGPDGSPAYY